MWWGKPERKQKGSGKEARESRKEAKRKQSSGPALAGPLRASLPQGGHHLGELGARQGREVEALTAQEGGADLLGKLLDHGAVSFAVLGRGAVAAAGSPGAGAHPPTPVVSQTLRLSSTLRHTIKTVFRRAARCVAWRC